MNKPDRVLRMPGLENRNDAEPQARTRDFLSRGEVARLFGVSPSTVTRWARSGLVASVRTPGGHYRFRAQDALLAVQAAERGKEKAS
jgi:excisionase family DNA binding protein